MFRKYEEAELTGLRDGLSSAVNVGKLRKREKPKKHPSFCPGPFVGPCCCCLPWGILVEMFREHVCRGLVRTRDTCFVFWLNYVTQKYIKRLKIISLVWRYRTSSLCSFLWFSLPSCQEIVLRRVSNRLIHPNKGRDWFRLCRVTRQLTKFDTYMELRRLIL